jgi:hypothetical protein
MVQTVMHQHVRLISTQRIRRAAFVAYLKHVQRRIYAF